MMDVHVDLRIEGGTTVLPDGTSPVADVDIGGGRIVAVRRHDVASDVAAGDRARDATPSTTIDARGRIVAPGLIDLQINGGWGHDFTTDPASIRVVARRLPSTGVTAFVPTIVTASPARRHAAFAAFADLGRHAAPPAATAIGLHFEGPIISRSRRGAHAAEWVGMPEVAELDRWNTGNGLAIVTLAPEVDGAIELIGELTRRGVVVSVGHTACDVETFAAARAAGATLVTHLFNAMAPFDHREPGPIGATLADGGVRAGLICDGVHSDPVAIRVAWRALGAARTVLVTDAVAALGLDAASTRFGSLDAVIDDVSVRLADGTLAGSKLALDQAIRNLVAMTRCTPAEAIRAASTTPADALGLVDRGRIEPGARADLVIFDESLRVERTLIGGRSAWKS